MFGLGNKDQAASDKAQLTQVMTLMRSDLEAIEAYNEAIPEIDTPEFATKLKGFLDEHEQNARELAQYARTLGGEPPATDDDHESTVNEHLAPIGDTKDTLLGVKHICEQEWLTIERYEAFMSMAPQGPLHDLASRHLSRAHERFEYLKHARISVEAAAKLWGPQDRPLTMNH